MNAEVSTDTRDKIIQQLEETKKEIEQFLQELNLDNTTVEQRYQQLREEFKSSLNEMEKLMKQKQDIPNDVSSTLLALVSEIKIRLESPQRDAVTDLKELIKGIKKGLKELASAVRDDTSLNETLEKIHDQLQRYRLKFEIIKLKLALRVLKVKYTGKDMQYQLNLKIQALSKFLRENKHSAEERMRKLRLMVSRIYSAFSKIYS